MNLEDPRRRWGLACLPLAIMLLSFAHSYYARRVYPSGWDGYYVLSSVLAAGFYLACATVLITILFAWRTRPAAAGAPNATLLPLLVGMLIALPPFALVGLIAGLRRTIAGNEVEAASHQQALRDAQFRYAIVNGGLHDRPACLANPTGCLPESKRRSAALHSDIAACLGGQKSPCSEWTQRAEPFPDLHARRLYLHLWVPGPAADPAEIERRGASASSVIAGAWLATPVAPALTGNWEFCADSTGRVCGYAGSEKLKAPGGLCPRHCMSLP